MPEVPQVQFATSGTARLAYQIHGEGPNLVAIPPTAQHIEMAWEWPDIRAMLEQFGSFSRHLAFDKRGTGASDRRSVMPGIDERVEDLRAVMDDAGFESAHLFACSEGGPMAVMFAVTYPERVDSLIFHGSCAAQVPVDADQDWIDARRSGFEAYAALWGTSDSPVAAGFAPSLADNEEFIEWHQKYERTAADAGSLVDLLELTLEMDVRDVLAEVRAPTLVLHRRDDRVIPLDWGRELAEGIPGARLIELDGDDHFQYAGDVDAWMDEVERWVTGTVSERRRSPTPLVEIQTLGRFAVFRDGVEVDPSLWGGRLARQICKRLVAARGWPVTRDELIDMCWPDESDMRRLSARLSVQLSMVRRVLSGGVIADRSAVRLDLGAVSTDLTRFFEASTDTDVMDLYPGDFLPEDLYEDWARPTRDEARSRFLAAGYRLLEGSDLNLNVTEQVARRLIQADPYDEAAHEALISALEQAGEIAAAEDARGAWALRKDELGI